MKKNVEIVGAGGVKYFFYGFGFVLGFMAVVVLMVCFIMWDFKFNAYDGVVLRGAVVVAVLCGIINYFLHRWLGV